MDAFEPQRRPAPEFEPPLDPGDAPSLRGLGLVARIMRGRELAADAAGIPPLDSDQVLDLQRTAGNRLTSGALSRWTDALPGEVNIAQELLASLHADPGLRDAIAAALDGLDATVVVHVTGPAEPVAIDAIGPRGGAAIHVTPPATIELPLNALFGPATSIEPDHALELTIAAQHTVNLPVPFKDAASAGGYTARAELRS